MDDYTLTLGTGSTTTKYKKRSTIEEAKEKLRGKINRRAMHPPTTMPDAQYESVTSLTLSCAHHD